jgi:hypothetical protein
VRTNLHIIACAPPELDPDPGPLDCYRRFALAHTTLS